MEPAPRERKTAGWWLLAALLVWAGITVATRLRAKAEPERPSWQAPVSALQPGQQQLHARLRAAMPEAEAARARTGAWPEQLTLAPTWQLRRQGQTVNYLAEAEGLRWLVLYLEPDPRLAAEPAPPEDDEHHTLPDGTPVHVTVWTQPLNEPAPGGLVAFPAAEGWVERVRR